MGNDVAEAVEGLPLTRTFKVHGRMCSELLKLITRVSKIFPEIEGARPRCSSGIEALCLLNNGIAKAKSLLQHCSESSALYLALTGDAILSRCKKSKNLLEQSLSQIQNMVPVMLAAKISGVIAELRSTVFRLDPSEEEAGKVLRELLHRYGSTIDSSVENAIADIHTVSSRLHISSQKALLTEKRSIRKLLDKFGETEPTKRKILLLFLNLLNKYGKTAISKDQNDNENPFPFARPYHLSSEMELCVNYMPNEAQIDIQSRRVPPEEFMCPLSSRLMHDPVVISSGQTYERAWIQKWFDEGHNTCPKTNMKLLHFSVTSNTVMKELILKWCATNGVSIPDAAKFNEGSIKPWEISTNSIASLTSSMNDLNFPLDFSNVSMGSSNDVKPSSHEIDMEFLSKFSTLSWDLRCNAVEDVKRLLNKSDDSWLVIPLGKFVQLLVSFLKDAHELHDVEALLTGCQLLLEFLQKYRNSTLHIKEDTYALLASFLDTEVSKQALSILEVLSFNKQCVHSIALSNALIGILNILDSQIQELLEPALQIMTNLSLHCDITSFLVPSEVIPRIIPLLEDNNLARYCLTILKNMCDNEDAKVAIAESHGCVASIAKILDKDSHEEQEHAVSILLSLCSQRVEYCQLVMEEGIMGLVSVSINGNRKAKAMAMELLRIMRDERCTSGESSVSRDDSVDLINERVDKNPPKSHGLFGKIFSKKKK